MQLEGFLLFIQGRQRVVDGNYILLIFYLPYWVVSVHFSTLCEYIDSLNAKDAAASKINYSIETFLIGPTSDVSKSTSFNSHS